MPANHFLAATLTLCLSLAGSPAWALKSGPPRSQPIDMVVIHSTGGPTCDAATGQPVWIGGGTLAEDIATIEAHPSLGIHYMIDRDGTRVASVPESQVAHHVFRYSVRSIAIELINDGDGVDPFPEAQIDSLVTLLREIRARRGIAKSGLVRHSDLDTARMACEKSRRRKVDPGDAFPFQAVRERVFAP